MRRVAERREVMLTVRLVGEERAEYEEAARRAGLDMSDWVRGVLGRACEARPPERQDPVVVGVGAS